MQNLNLSTIQELSNDELAAISGGVIFDDWWTMNRDACVDQRISKYDLITAF